MSPNRHKEPVTSARFLTSGAIVAVILVVIACAWLGVQAYQNMGFAEQANRE